VLRRNKGIEEGLGVTVCGKRTEVRRTGFVENGRTYKLTERTFTMGRGYYYSVYGIEYGRLVRDAGISSLGEYRT
jgi:hypothetical protein